MMKWVFAWVCLVCFQFSVALAAAWGEGMPVVETGAASLAGITILDLDVAKRIALADNPGLAAAETRLHQASERVRQASAAYLPRVDATGSASRVGLSDNSLASQLETARLFDPSASIDDPEDYFSAGLNASYVVFDGFARKYNYEVEQLGEMQAQEATREARRLLLSAVATAFFNAQLARENIAIAVADETFNLRQVAEAEARLRVGTGALSDVLNFKIQVNAAKSRMNQFNLEYRRFIIGLAALMGVPDAGLPPGLDLNELVSEDKTEMILPETEVLVAEALAKRPDLKVTDFRIQQSEARIQLARSALFPMLNLSAELTGNRDNDTGFESDDFGYTVGVKVSYNLFSGGATQARVREARWAQSEAEKLYADLSLTVASDVRDAVAQLDRAQSELKLQRANTALVEKNRDLVAKEYAAGQGTLVRLNEAQRDLITAQSRLALALVSLRQAWQNVESATGRILSVAPDAMR